LLEGPDLPIVVCGHSDYGTEITGPKPITFKAVWDAADNDGRGDWAQRDVEALDLFDTEAPSHFSVPPGDPFI
jgi:hypothetical protein